MISFNNETKSKCVGCEACRQICPKSCITMKRDKEGFLYPFIEQDKCIGCNLCEKICPLKYEYKSEGYLDKPYTVGLNHRDEIVRYDSSSGGAFTLLSEWILSHDGIVYGSTLNSEMKPIHVGIEKIEELHILRGSKYVQSELGNVYSEIKNNLGNDRYVLFVGTPCQTAGLISFLGQAYDKLYTCDFVCHGVPSPMMFEEYIKYLETKNRSRVKSFRFRNKDKGWNQTGLHLGTLIEFENGEKIRNYPAFKDPFMNGFLLDLYCRPSCHECIFKKYPKITADFTIGDFWGVNRVIPEMNDGKGTSLVIIHSEKGLKLFGETRDSAEVTEADYDSSVKTNIMVGNIAKPSPSRQSFFNDFEKKGFDFVRRRYMNAFAWIVMRAGFAFWNIIEKTVRIILSPIVKKIKPSWNEDDWSSLFQFVKFALVGVSNVCVSYSVNVVTLLLLRSANYSYDYVIGNGVAFLLSVLWSFYWNNRHVFKQGEGEKRSFWKSLLKTYASYAFSCIVLSNILGTLWIKVLGISKYVSPLLNLWITIPTNYLMNKYWAFGKKKTSN